MMTLDIQIFKFINGRLGCAGLDPFMLLATTCGTGAVQVALSLALIAIGWIAGRVNIRQAGYAAIIACPVSSIVIAVAKQIFGRPRPLLALWDVRLVGDPLFANSYPSGHTLTTFAVAAAVSVFIPKLRFALFPLALLTGFSRVYVGAHFPLDVVAGALLGALVGLWSAQIVKHFASEKEAPACTSEGASDA